MKISRKSLFPPIYVCSFTESPDNQEFSKTFVEQPKRKLSLVVAVSREITN